VTRRDYELIADVLSSCRPVQASGQADPIVTALADEHKFLCAALAAKLRSTNPRFDTGRFLAACGVSA
jgi:hypothetical protein